MFFSALWLKPHEPLSHVADGVRELNKQAIRHSKKVTWPHIKKAKKSGE
jgi:hypothetical protein